MVYRPYTKSQMMHNLEAQTIRRLCCSCSFGYVYTFFSRTFNDTAVSSDPNLLNVGSGSLSRMSYMIILPGS